MKREVHWLDGIERIRDADTTDLRKLAELSSKSPATFYRGADLRGVSFAGADLRGLRFNGAQADWTTADDDTQSDCAFFWQSYFCYSFGAEIAITQQSEGLEKVQSVFDNINNVSNSNFVRKARINPIEFKRISVLSLIEAYVQSSIKYLFDQSIMNHRMSEVVVETYIGPKIHFTAVVSDGPVFRRLAIYKSPHIFRNFESGHLIEGSIKYGIVSDCSESIPDDDIV